MANAVVFVDPRVANHGDLLAAIRSRAEIVFLLEDEDGLLQIAKWLETYPGIDAVHLISHGAKASLILGSSEINLLNLSAYTQVLSSIGAALNPGADILLYGCDVGSGESGQAFIEQLALLIGADVAASDDPTGAREKRGDAELETVVGAVDADPILSQADFDSLDLLLLWPPDPIGTGPREWIWTNHRGDSPAFSDRIESDTERDYYRFFANATGSYTITVSAATLDSAFRVYNSSGNAITNVIDVKNTGGTETTTVSLTADNWYYIGIGGYKTSTGSYSLSIDGPDPYLNDVSTPGPTYSATVPGDISPAGDIDWFKLIAPSGTTFLNLSVAPSSKLDTIIQLLDSSGTPVLGKVIDTGGAGGIDSRNSIAVTAGATYYVGVTSLGSGSYKLSADFNPDQTLPVLSIGALSANKPEGSGGGTTPFTFTVTRTGNISKPSSVHWSVGTNQDPGADASDFRDGVLPSGTLNWAANDDTPRTITVHVNADSTYEGGGLPDHFIVKLSNPTGAEIKTAIANGSIQNDDSLGVRKKSATVFDGTSISLTRQDGASLNIDPNAKETWIIVHGLWSDEKNFLILQTKLTKIVKTHKF